MEPCYNRSNTFQKVKDILSKNFNDIIRNRSQKLLLRLSESIAFEIYKEDILLNGKTKFQTSKSGSGRHNKIKEYEKKEREIG
uniref:Uncharacterized protein n=1 Tax=Rhizophagus irregularis (strain DAOM 181602 / DAOM 197198 / MUCL 43194) TaxID=747089 RepID=U9TL49_RHIID